MVKGKLAFEVWKVIEFQILWKKVMTFIQLTLGVIYPSESESA